MKVLLVVTKGDLGGAQKRILDLAREYKKDGIEITVGVGNEGDWLPAQLRRFGISHYRFRNLERSKNPLSILLFLFELRKYLTRKEFDIVHLNSSNSLAGAPGVWLADTNAKTVFTFRGLSVLSPNYSTHFLLRLSYRWYFRLSLLFVDAGVFQCKADRNKASELGIHSKKTTVIRPGINPKDIGYLYREKARQKLSNHLETGLLRKKIIGTIGRLSPEKNHGFLIDSFKQVTEKINDCALVIIGGGSDREVLEKQVENAGLEAEVFFAGAIPGAARLIPGFDLFVLPSLYEGVSVTLTEAVHAGVSILASDVGGNRETLCGNEASLFSLGGEDELAERIEKLVADPQTREQATPKDGCKKTLLLSESAKEYKSLYESLV